MSLGPPTQPSCLTSTLVLGWVLVSEHYRSRYLQHTAAVRDGKMADEGPSAFAASRGRFMRWGQRNAQFLGVILASAGTIYFLGSRVQKLQDQRDHFETKLQGIQPQIQAARAETKTARAEAIQQCNDKFLMYGYAAEYQALQKKALGEKAPQHSDNT